jgi:peptidoglycan/xylan/chitin deacetylase (PgdA/CDA1 family)
MAALRVPGSDVLATAPAAPAFVLMYHRVDEDANDPFDLVVDPRRFREQLRRLGQIADVVPLRELLQPTSGERPRAAITFDDGYVDNLEQALPELERAGMPASLFAISDLLGRDEECWWDQLEQIFRAGWARTRPISLKLRGLTLAGEIGCDVGSLKELHSHLLPLSAGEIAPLIETLREQLAAPAPVLERRLMSEDELRRLDASSCVEVGAHTRTHPKLPSLSAGEQADELAGSRARLEQVLGRPVDTFSYPFGAYDANTLSAAAAAGFVCACTTEPGLVQRPGDRLRLPRIAATNCDGYEFARTVNAWLAKAA